MLIWRVPPVLVIRKEISGFAGNADVLPRSACIVGLIRHVPQALDRLWGTIQCESALNHSNIRTASLNHRPAEFEVSRLPIVPLAGFANVINVTQAAQHEVIQAKGHEDVCSASNHEFDCNSFAGH